MEVTATWSRVLPVWWAHFWRNIIASFVCGALSGGIVGFFMGYYGCSMETVQIVTSRVGFFAGLAASVIPMKMVIGLNYGGYRLVLISDSESPDVAAESVD
ncbi:hypothetical protein [Calycomorphotria hydatis]|uniref:Uncharacterized protein n=1 Tax=Calycomorphotria hydatis TaxID=2528027 RepID=A0A517TDW6_9PLAN|nr:hypothetical protein [Calycomorphotria hydatis]QDT66568.1 hypothetical protein V22_38380 [Calycomorphotria hydatis]